MCRKMVQARMRMRVQYTFDTHARAFTISCKIITLISKYPKQSRCMLLNNVIAALKRIIHIIRTHVCSGNNILYSDFFYLWRI